MGDNSISPSSGAKTVSANNQVETRQVDKKSDSKKDEVRPDPFKPVDYTSYLETLSKNQVELQKKLLTLSGNPNSNRNVRAVVLQELASIKLQQGLIKDFLAK